MHWGPTVDGKTMLLKTPLRMRFVDTVGEAYHPRTVVQSRLTNFNAGRLE